jgi:hypothetical protein
LSSAGKSIVNFTTYENKSINISTTAQTKATTTTTSTRNDVKFYDSPFPGFRQSDDEDGTGQEVGVARCQAGQERREGVPKVRPQKNPKD